MVKLRKSVRQPASIATDTPDRQALSHLVSHRVRVRVSSLFLGVCVVSCVEDFSERAPLLDTSVQFELVSHADGDRLTVINPAFEFHFDDYLDVRASALGSAFTIQAGVHRPRLESTWDAVGQTLMIQPLDSLRVGLVYTLSADPERLRGLGSRSVDSSQNEWLFRVAEDAGEREEIEAPRLSYYTDIRPILVDGCSCHWAPETALTPLEPSALAERADQRSGRSLVVPFDPARSYLLEKILDGYPDRFGTQMPPPWADEGSLTSEQVQLVHDWIAGGAIE